METQVKAVVQDVKENIHKKGELYAEAIIKGGLNRGERVTFTLAHPVWKEKDEEGNVIVPERGIGVFVSDVRWKNNAGWRAYRARFLRLGENKEAEETAVCRGQGLSSEKIRE